MKKSKQVDYLGEVALQPHRRYLKLIAFWRLVEAKECLAEAIKLISYAHAIVP